MTINQERMQLFEADLRSAFELLDLKIEDESHLHAGHAGAASGGGHFKIRIVSPQFEGMNSVKRHRAIYAALSSHFPQAIHALTIEAMSPAEYTP
ncbi:BolA family transcriptional regulator [Polynucleobacter sp. es-EL-1]|jgi:BolA protein|uniref:BolA family protein n=1 Tax=Polynucleobacter sp. es-EL-1 TaxID=1855652 RepID=UPI001BFCEDF9|nr:BolA family protein [Polynucleobacter sp. es-EL-1]HQR84785.1 BolA family protein [Polynucleobacter sp.]QWE11429.1 BolA family transcriptional regulator [Polynucleobacter sp. es-EL-1]HQS61636.1 BolA family protein [Polynucleobacter sp.]HQT21174.1 BolA family protein [Polynucleobacter sp.]HQT41991.1 BolA family protein [Polynucleobacter sp.]